MVTFKPNKGLGLLAAILSSWSILSGLVRQTNARQSFEANLPGAVSVLLASKPARLL
ncbi:hypothetical protein LX32DRAFT_642607 [Colletotrichum zoysiae]|uniref:Uncharacterized protein n=1 Tax=Colletotrichum zoysiae TaxID=1216348 RepID=A0AAD9LYD4_9PEZI|nr:hypothetical protein LX32DRAFT_642607 [Colletotrichum zoysiae]